MAQARFPCLSNYSNGHANPTIEVVHELTRRGHEVRYCSFEEFRERIEDAGAQLVVCDSFLPPIDEKAEKRLRRVSTTEMGVQSFRTVANLDPVVSEDVAHRRAPKEKVGRPLVYASFGTVINDRPGFYRTLIDALRDADADLLISCGRAFDLAQLRMLPDIVRVEQHVDQMEVLSRASLSLPTAA